MRVRLCVCACVCAFGGLFARLVCCPDANTCLMRFSHIPRHRHALGATSCFCLITEYIYPAKPSGKEEIKGYMLHTLQVGLSPCSLSVVRRLVVAASVLPSSAPAFCVSCSLTILLGPSWVSRHCCTAMRTRSFTAT